MVNTDAKNLIMTRIAWNPKTYRAKDEHEFIFRQY